MVERCKPAGNVYRRLDILRFRHWCRRQSQLGRYQGVGTRSRHRQAT